MDVESPLNLSALLCCMQLDFMEVFTRRPDSTYVVPPEPVTTKSESDLDDDEEEETVEEEEQETDGQKDGSDNTSDDH